MRTKKKLLVSIFSGIACLATAFAFVCTPKTSKTVSAESVYFPVRETYQYELDGAQSTVYFSETDSFYNAVTNGAYVCEIPTNPWQKTIRTNITFSEIAWPGVQFFGGASDYYQPGICLFSNWQGTYVEMYNRWDKSADYADHVNIPIDGIKLKMNFPYTVEYGFANEVTEDVLSGYVMYFKLMDTEGEEIINETARVNPNVDSKGVQVDYSGAAYSEIGGFGGVAQGNAFGLLSSAPDLELAVEPLTADEDISYFWNREDNKPINITEKYRTNYNADDSYEWRGTDSVAERFLAPGYDNRMTFRFKGDPNYALGKYCFVLGFVDARWDYNCCAFKMDFVNKNLALGNSTVATTTKMASWNGDLNKEYDVSLAVRRITRNGILTQYVMLQMDVTEVGTVQTTSLSGVVRLIEDMFDERNDKNKYEKRFEVFTGVVSQDVERHDATLKCTISSANPCYTATLMDGENSTTMKVSTLVLPEPKGEKGKTFIGWACGNEFYQAGETLLVTKNMFFVANYAQFGTIEAAAIQVEVGTGGYETSLRFKGYVNGYDWSAFGANVEIYMLVDRADGEEVKYTIAEEDLYYGAHPTCQEFAVYVDITGDATATYSTVYEAKTFITVTYANDEVKTFSSDEVSRNSVEHIASVILANENGACDPFLNNLLEDQLAVLQSFVGDAQN